MPQTRQPNRLPLESIYNSNNGFFITICTHNKECIFTDGLKPNKLGQIIQKEWSNLTEQFTNIELGEFVIMPNHFHGIITFLDIPTRKSNIQEVGLSEIIRTFKAKTTKIINEVVGAGFTRPHGIGEYSVSAVNQSTNGSINASPTKIWQKSFYDHVIRNEKDLQRIREYIFNNPLNWEMDSLNPKNL